MTRPSAPTPHPLAALVAAFVWPILLLLAIVVVGLVLAFPAPARRPAPVVIAPAPPLPERYPYASRYQAPTILPCADVWTIPAPCDCDGVR